MNEIEKAIRHFRNLKDKNFVVLNDFRKEIEMKKAIGNDNYYGSTLVYENRDKYYSIAISALEKQQELKKYLHYLQGFIKYDTLQIYEVADRIEEFIVEEIE